MACRRAAGSIGQSLLGGEQRLSGATVNANLVVDVRDVILRRARRDTETRGQTRRARGRRPRCSRSLLHGEEGSTRQLKSGQESSIESLCEQPTQEVRAIANA